MTDKPNSRYTLLAAMLIVRRLDTQSTRAEVFTEIKAKNRLIRWVSNIYDCGGALGLRRLIIWLYISKCAMSLPQVQADNCGIIAVAGFENEAHTVARVQALLPDVPVDVLRPTLRSALKPARFVWGLRMIWMLPRLWRLLGQLSRRHSFMPACRVGSTVGYYMRSRMELAHNAGLNIGLVASNYSPEALGFAAAIHANGGQLIYANHAPVPRKGPYLPPVLSDVAVLYGAANLDAYQTQSRISARPILAGQPGRIEAMRIDANPQTVGIFLTALTLKSSIASYVAQISAADPSTKVLIRHHPVSLLQTDLSDLDAKYPNLKITSGTSLEADTMVCDLVLCGNSGVAMNAVQMGRPVGFVPEFDELPLDYTGFWEHGLVARMSHWSKDEITKLYAHYSAEEWLNVMKTYDASYGQDAAQFQKQISDELRAALNL